MKLARRDLAKAGTAALAVAGLGIRTARAESSSAPNVVVYCDPALRQVFTSLDAPFRASGGARLNVFCAAPWMMLAQIERVTQNDILVTAAPVMEDAKRLGLVMPPTLLALGRNRLGLAARGSPAASAVDPAAIRALLGAGPLAAPDPTSITTIDSAAALAAIGLAPPYPFRLLPAADTEDVAFLLAGGAARFGLLYATEIAPGDGFALAARLPAPTAAPYVAAISTVTRSPNASQFMDFLRSPGAQERLRSAGLENVA